MILYEAAFRENEINEKVLPSLTAEDLGVVIVGQRRMLLDAIETCALMQVRKHHRPQRLANVPGAESPELQTLE